MRTVLNSNSKVTVLRSDLHAVINQGFLDVPGNLFQIKSRDPEEPQNDIELKCNIFLSYFVYPLKPLLAIVKAPAFPLVCSWFPPQWEFQSCHNPKYWKRANKIENGACNMILLTLKVKNERLSILTLLKLSMAAGVEFVLLNDVPSRRRLTNRVDNLLSFYLTKRRFQVLHFAFSSVINQSTRNHLLWPDFKILYAELDKDYWPFSFHVLSLYCSLWD